MSMEILFRLGGDESHNEISRFDMDQGDGDVTVVSAKILTSDPDVMRLAAKTLLEQASLLDEQRAKL